MRSTIQRYGQHDEAPGAVGAFDDLERQAGRLFHRDSGRGTLIAACLQGALDEREQAAHLSEQRRNLVAVCAGPQHLNAGSLP